MRRRGIGIVMPYSRGKGERGEGEGKLVLFVEIP